MTYIFEFLVVGYPRIKVLYPQIIVIGIFCNVDLSLFDRCPWYMHPTHGVTYGFSNSFIKIRV